MILAEKFHQETKRAIEILSPAMSMTQQFTLRNGIAQFHRKLEEDEESGRKILEGIHRVLSKILEK